MIMDGAWWLVALAAEGAGGCRHVDARARLQSQVSVQQGGVTQRVDGVAEADAGERDRGAEDGDLEPGRHPIGDLAAADEPSRLGGALVLAFPGSLEKPPAPRLGVPTTTAADVVPLEALFDEVRAPLREHRRRADDLCHRHVVVHAARADSARLAPSHTPHAV